MKALFRARTVAALGILGFASMMSLAEAGPRSACDQISKDVREAVSKDPAKVLMIVEDALVINETCACEIIKAAIIGSGADAAMVQQIVQTALAVAPKMSAIIAECATAVAPGSAEAIAAIAGEKGKTIVADTSTGDGKGVVAAVAPVAPAEVSDFSNAWSANLRGVYLVQPAAAGFITQVALLSDSDQGRDEHTEDKDGDVNRANSRRTRNLVPLSPTNAHP